MPALKQHPELVTVTFKPEGRVFEPAVYAGVEFPVNEPVLLDPKNRKHHVTQLLGKKCAHPTLAGATAISFEEERVFLADMLKENPDFEVEGHERAIRRKPVGRVPPPGSMWTEDHAGEIMP